MGYKTYESIGRPLKNRINIVITSKVNICEHGCLFVNIHELDSILNIYKSKTEHKKDMFIIGGVELICKYITDIERIHLTTINRAFACDRYIDIDFIRSIYNDTLEESGWFRDAMCDYKFELLQKHI